MQFCIGYSKNLSVSQIKDIMNKYSSHETSYCSKLNLLLAADSPTLSEHGELFFFFIKKVIMFRDIRKLKTGINQLSARHPVKVKQCFRGIECSEQEFESYVLGEQLHIPSFMSTSIDKNKSYKNNEINTHFIITLKEIPKNACMLTSAYSKYASSEEEALFSCYSLFKVVRKQRDITVNGKSYKY